MGIYLVQYSNAAAPANLTTAQVLAATGQVVDVIPLLMATQARLNAIGKQNSTLLPFRLNVGETIVANYLGVGAALVDFQYDIIYHAMAAGGILV
jgi:hypothetical protein